MPRSHSTKPIPTGQWRNNSYHESDQGERIEPSSEQFAQQSEAARRFACNHQNKEAKDREQREMPHGVSNPKHGVSPSIQCGAYPAA